MTAEPARLSHPPVIDFHAHMLDEAVLELAGSYNPASGFGATAIHPPTGSRRAAKFEKMLRPDAQIEDMDAQGIDMNVITPSPVMMGMKWADAQTALQVDRQLNDAIAEWARDHPGRFIATCTLPLQDLDLAFGELARCVADLGVRVVQLPAQVGGAYLGDPPLRALWEALADQGLVVFVHPDGVDDPWFQRHALWNSIGQLIEETKAQASLILGGVLDAFPGVPIVIAHGGGFLPHYCSRLDRIHRTRPQDSGAIAKLPSGYLTDFYYDTCVYDPEILKALTARVGAGRLLMGGDYPIGDPDPTGFVHRCREAIGDQELPEVLGARAAALVGLEREMV